MDEDPCLRTEPLLTIIDLLYQIGNINDMGHEFFGRLGKLIPFDAAFFSPINWKTLELQEGIYVGNTNLSAQNNESGEVPYNPLLFDFLCLTQLNVTLKLSYTASNSFIAPNRPDQKYLWHTMGVIAGWHQYPVAAIRLFRQGKATDFTEHETKILDRLAVHLGNALYLEQANAALETMGETGLIAFDANGKVLYKNGFVNNRVAEISSDSILQIVQNGGVWLKNGMELYRLENIPLTSNSLLALHAKEEKQAETTTPIGAKVNILASQGISIISIKPFQRRSAFENRLKLIGLSRREIDVTLKVMRGLSNNNIAKQMYIDETTVKGHLKHIYAKINIKTRTELISKLLGLDIELAAHEIPIASDVIRRD